MSKLSVFIRTEHNYDMDLASSLDGLSCLDPSLAQQNSRDECDINVIMERFGRGAELPQNFRPPQYADFVGVSDYHSALNAVAAAAESFDAMPATLRSRFANDPSQLMAFLDDPENRQEAVKLGLLPKPSPIVSAASSAAIDPSTGEILLPGQTVSMPKA